MTHRCRIRWFALFCLVLFYIPGAVYLGQNDKNPLTEEEVMALATAVRVGGTTVERATELIQSRGVSFSLTPLLLLEFEAKGADAAILETLRRLGEKGTPKQVPADKTNEDNSSLVGAKLPDGTTLDETQLPKFLAEVRAKALSYTDDLPNFICTQMTRRAYRFFPGGWQDMDNFVADLSYYDRKEHYKIISVSNRPTANATMEGLKGARSSGEFGTTMKEIFDAGSKASFRLEGPELNNGRETVRLSFFVPLETSKRSIAYEEESMPTQTIVTAYRGRIWVDPASYQVVRIEERAVSIPPEFPITRAEGSVEYDLAEIAGRKYWLPLRAEMLLVQGASKMHSRNVIEFKRYRKFEAEVKLVSDE
jgi:hypothetical protein